MRRKFLVVLLIAVLFSVQDASLARASSVYDESLEIDVSIDSDASVMFLWLTVSSPDGPFSASEFASEPSFNSLNIESHDYFESAQVGDLVINYTTQIQIGLNVTSLADSAQRKAIADALKRKIEDYFQIFLIYIGHSQTTYNGIDEYNYVSDVPITDELRFEFSRQELPGLSQLLSSNLTAGYADVRLGLEKIGGSFLWTYQVIGFGGNLFKINFGQEYSASLNEILKHTGTINPATGGHSSSIYFRIYLENNNFTFVPLGSEPQMNVTKGEPSYYIFYANVTGESFYDVAVRFKIVQGADLTIYVAAAVLSVFSCAVGLFLYRKRRLRSSRYR